MGIVAIGGAVIGAVGSMSASNKQAKASAAQMAFEKEKYDYAKGNLENEAEWSDRFFDAALGEYKKMNTHASVTNATAFQGKAEDAKAVLANMDSFIEKFQKAIGNNTEAMDTFSRRYGPIMDNVADGIMNVSQARLSASGREQLSLDRDTIMKDMDQRLATAGINRSGINVEMADRMSMDFAKQSRKIDVDSYGQANQLQAQGTNTLNSMYGIGENIRGRSEQLQAGFAGGMLQGELANSQMATGVNVGNAQRQAAMSQFNAQTQTGVSLANAGAENKASMFNAQVDNAMHGAAGNLAAGQSQRRQNAWLSFNSGIGQNDGVANAYQQQANAAGQDAAGWGSFAGSMLGKSNMFDKKEG